MHRMNKEEFNRKYMDTHTELSALDRLEQGRKGSVVKHSPGDKNIYSRGKIPGKNVIENKCFEKRAEDTKHYLLDALEVRSLDILDKEQMPIDKLVNSVIKTLPQKQEVKLEGEFTFASMLEIAKKQQTAVEDGEVVE